jgi:hypothetical protein
MVMMSRPYLAEVRALRTTIVLAPSARGGM